MRISELFDIINENNVDLQLVGEVELNDFDENIKWSYDGLSNGHNFDNMDAHLQVIYEGDQEVIEEFLNEKNLIDDFMILLPDNDDTVINFLILES